VPGQAPHKLSRRYNVDLKIWGPPLRQLFKHPAHRSGVRGSYITSMLGSIHAKGNLHWPPNFLEGTITWGIHYRNMENPVRPLPIFPGSDPVINPPDHSNFREAIRSKAAFKVYWCKRSSVPCIGSTIKNCSVYTTTANANHKRMFGLYLQCSIKCQYHSGYHQSSIPSNLQAFLLSEMPFLMLPPHKQIFRHTELLIKFYCPYRTNFVDFI